MQNKSQTISMMPLTNSTSLQKLQKIDFKIAKISKLDHMSSIVYYLLPWQLVMWFCKDYFFNKVRQELHHKYDAMN